ncbi:MAG: phosphotransferase family protein [Hyphomicrobiales bacterium]|nr:phosphotransferase family protein [Hyphomicrobiales bacterium]
MTENMPQATADIEDRLRALPVWTGTPEWQPLKGGLSNESFLVRDGSGTYVARFGRDFPFHHVARDREIMATRAAVAGGFAPELVFAEPGIMVSRFIEGQTYVAEDVRANAGRIADLIRRFHNEMPKHVEGPGFIFWVFHVIRDYARTLKKGDSRMSDRLPEFLALAEELEAAQTPLPIIFGHHDLLPANFIDDGARLWLIDFEYAGFGTPMFDLAGIASNAGFGENETAELLTRYFGAPPSEPILRSHAAMQCASLLREAMWSMVSELHLDVPGVDYVAYTAENLDALDRALAAYRTRFGKA